MADKNTMVATGALEGDQGVVESQGNTLVESRRRFVTATAIGLLGLSLAVSAAPAELTKTKDGRDFAGLNEKDADALSDEDFDRYSKWRITQKEAKLNQVTAKVKTAELELGKKASEAIPLLLIKAQKREKVVLSAELKSAIEMIANGKIPPVEMQADAKKLLAYLA